MNVTQHYEYSRIIWQYTPPIIIFIGTIGHILTITAVNYYARKATSFSVYLTALAVVDPIVLTLNNWLLCAFNVSVKDSGRALFPEFLSATFILMDCDVFNRRTCILYLLV